MYEKEKKVIFRRTQVIRREEGGQEIGNEKVKELCEKIESDDQINVAFKMYSNINVFAHILGKRNRIVF